MNVHDLIGDRPWPFAVPRPVLGLDLGSRASKGVLLAGEEVFTAVVPTGLLMQETADDLVARLLRQAKVRRRAVARVVGTGYGRISLAFPDLSYDVVTEISCHALGAHALVPQARTLLDIGGQDSKAIKLDPATGKVVEFVMNDKCAAGTGRFLEKAATLLGIDLADLGEVALQATAPSLVSSQCVVFAESELISLRARSERAHDERARANIAAGVHLSAARRVTNLLGRVGLEPALVFTGGVSNNRGMWATLEELLGTRFVPRAGFDMMFAGALGAAAHAAREVRTRARPARRRVSSGQAELARALAAVEGGEQALVAAQGVKKVGFLCAYTPVELLRAAGVAYTRLAKAGDPATVAAGELHTQSALCDHTKSCIGGFLAGDPVSTALDKVYSPHACGNMKRASEIIGELVPTRLVDVPKNVGEPGSRSFFRSELLALKGDLEVLTGRFVDDEAVRAQIAAYNEARRALVRVSELRKRARPPLSGREFVDLARGFWLLPPERIVADCAAIHERLRRSRSGGGRTPLRLLLCGSIMAHGDRRLLDLVEEKLGARVVAEDHCAGLRPLLRPIREGGDPWQALAEGYLDQSPCASRKPLSAAIDAAGRLAREYAVDGVLYVSLKFCSCYGLPKKAILDGFQELGLPVLDVSSDYSQSDHGQLATRLEAFVELLEHRREAGLGPDGRALPATSSEGAACP